MTPEAYCQDRATRHSTSLYYSVLFLGESERQAITTLYAYRREVGDVVGECSEAAVAIAKLDWWRGEIEDLFAGRPHHPVSRAIATLLNTASLPQEYFLEVIDGVQMDLEYYTYGSFADLLLYCHRVSATLCQMSAEILKYRDRKTRKFAHDLGMGLQLLRILRNVYADSRRGHIYLPLDEMDAFSVVPDDLTRRPTPLNVVRMCKLQSERIRRYLSSVLEQMPEVDRLDQLSSLTRAKLGLTLLEEIQADGFRVTEHRLELTPLRKLWIAWRLQKKERALISASS